MDKYYMLPLGVQNVEDESDWNAQSLGFCCLFKIGNLVKACILYKRRADITDPSSQ